MIWQKKFDLIYTDVKNFFRRFFYQPRIQMYMCVLKFYFKSEATGIKFIILIGFDIFLQ